MHGRAAVDHERGRLSTARARQPAYSRSADPKRANGREQCQRTNCIEARRCALAIAEELRELKFNFDFKLEAQKKWIKHNAEREAYQQVEREQGIAKRANNRLRRAKRDVVTSRRQVGELQAQVDSLARQLAASEAELQQKSTLVEEQSAELEALGRRLGGFEHTAKRLAEYKARTVEARQAKKAAVAEAQQQHAADLAAAQRDHEAQLEQERAAIELLDAEATAANESLEAMQQQVKQLTPPPAVTAEQWGKYTASS